MKIRGKQIPIGNISAAFLFALLSRIVLTHWHGVVDTGLLFYNMLLMALFISRRQETHADGKIVWGVAMIATVLPLVTYVPAQGLLSTRAQIWIGEFIQVISLGGMVWSAASLGPAIGIGPADRGLVQKGPYRYIRHPLYVFEFLFGIGYLTMYPSLHNGLAMILLTDIQVFRALREEKVIRGYEAYRQRVPGRFIPAIPGICYDRLKKQYTTQTRNEVI